MSAKNYPFRIYCRCRELALALDFSHNEKINFNGSPTSPKQGEKNFSGFDFFSHFLYLRLHR
jgi:hypothetical protein